MNLGDDLFKDGLDVLSISPCKGDTTFRSRRQSTAHVDILRNLGVAYLRQASHADDPHKAQDLLRVVSQVSVRHGFYWNVSHSLFGNKMVLRNDNPRTG